MKKKYTEEEKKKAAEAKAAKKNSMKIMYEETMDSVMHDVSSMTEYLKFAATFSTYSRIFISAAFSSETPITLSIAISVRQKTTIITININSFLNFLKNVHIFEKILHAPQNARTLIPPDLDEIRSLFFLR